MGGILWVEPCAICGGRSESLHHIYGRGQRGSDVLSNLAPVCRDSTRGCHGLLTARDPEALATLGRWIGAAFLTYLASVLGDTDRAWAWIDRNLLLSERKASGGALVHVPPQTRPGWKERAILSASASERATVQKRCGRLEPGLRRWTA